MAATSGASTVTVAVVPLGDDVTAAGVRVALAGLADHVEVLVVVAPGDASSAPSDAVAVLGDADVVCALAPAVDAVKVVAGEHPERVVGDVDRGSLRRPGRPQVVRRAALARALIAAADGPDRRGDPAVVVAAAGGDVRPWSVAVANDLDRP